MSIIFIITIIIIKHRVYLLGALSQMTRSGTHYIIGKGHVLCLDRS